jgi:hypothetical protein
MDAAILEIPPTTAFTSRRRLGAPVYCGRVVRRVAAGQKSTENLSQIGPRRQPQNASCKKYVFEPRFVLDLGPKIVPKTSSKSSPAMRLGRLRPWFVWTSCGRRSPKVPMQASLANLHQNPVFARVFVQSSFRFEDARNGNAVTSMVRKTITNSIDILAKSTEVERRTTRENWGRKLGVWGFVFGVEIEGD